MIAIFHNYNRFNKDQLDLLLKENIIDKTNLNIIKDYYNI